MAGPPTRTEARTTRFRCVSWRPRAILAIRVRRAVVTMYAFRGGQGTVLGGLRVCVTREMGVSVRTFSVGTAIAAAAIVATAAAPTAYAEGAVSSSPMATLDCDPRWYDDHLTVACYYNGKYRGLGSFYQTGSNGSESLHACDGYKDGRAVTAHLSWSDHHASIRDAGPPCAGKGFPIKEGTKVQLWVCVSGIGCGSKYNSYA